MKQILSIVIILWTVSLYAQLQSHRDMILTEMMHRPSEPWPRSEGHVVLALPGSLESEKGYLEPGGSFSPSFGSFGISFWQVNKVNKLEITSDNINTLAVKQSFTMEANPAILVECPIYDCKYKLNTTFNYTLEVNNKAGYGKRVYLVIRSVGPAGAPIHKIDVVNGGILINDLWKLGFTPTPAAIILGEESESDWITKESPSMHVESPTGWAYAKIQLNPAMTSVTVFANEKSFLTPLRCKTIYSDLKLQLPEPRFAASLNAQVAHLLMCTVRDECRPGEPNNYPLPWLRDGAYILSALARAGQVETAKTLALYFAKNDFFGGFGPEADAPGLAIWGIMQVAYEANDPAFDKEIWPHIKRKVQLIQKMLLTNESIRVPITGIVLKQTRQSPDSNLVCEAAKDGLIMGRMDWHRPVTFVNSVSYSGLKHAARLAEKLRQPEAAEWKNAAATLQQSWIKGFDTYWDNDRTFICSFWPDWIAAPIRDKYIDKATSNWNKLHDEDGDLKERPLWTYFNFSDAHQWLFLQQPEKAWKTLEYFWDRQTATGLYSWWEGNGEENSSGRWEHVCGWMKPPNVTPHCWTAAEALALQLDMLAFLDESGPEPVIVIGEGIKKEWISSPMKVEGMRLQGRTVSWIWDLKKLDVQIKGSKLKVRAGSAFPAKTKVAIKQL